MQLHVSARRSSRATGQHTASSQAKLPTHSSKRNGTGTSQLVDLLGSKERPSFLHLDSWILVSGDVCVWRWSLNYGAAASLNLAPVILTSKYSLLTLNARVIRSTWFGDLQGFGSRTSWSRHYGTKSPEGLEISAFCRCRKQPTEQGCLCNQAQQYPVVHR